MMRLSLSDLVRYSRVVVCYRVLEGGYHANDPIIRASRLRFQELVFLSLD